MGCIILDKQFIKRKLLFITKRIEYLNRYSSVKIDDISKEFEKIKAIEKVIQEIVDCAVDINQYLTEVMLKEEILSNKDSFWKIQQIINIDDGFIRKLIDTVSFRNELVHSYDVGIKRVWKERKIEYFVKIYKKYIESIYNLIQKD